MAIQTARSISSFHGPTDVKTSKLWPENDAYADEVASAVEYLLGEGGRNITGIVVTVDAGNTA